MFPISRWATIRPEHEGHEHTELLNGHENFENDVNRPHLHVSSDNPAQYLETKFRTGKGGKTPEKQPSEGFFDKKHEGDVYADEYGVDDDVSKHEAADRSGVEEDNVSARRWLSRHAVSKAALQR